MRCIDRMLKFRFFRRFIFVLMLVSILVAALNLNPIATAMPVLLALYTLSLLIHWDLSEWDRMGFFDD